MPGRLATLVVATALMATTSRATPPPISGEQVIRGQIEQFFLALSTQDIAQWSKVTSAEFYAFDGGLTYDRSGLWNTVAKTLKSAHYVWKPDVQVIRVSGKLATAVWVNHGSVDRGDGPVPVTWLETATFLQTGADWKVVFLSSQRALLSSAR
jgi:hypothetical protein